MVRSALKAAVSGSAVTPSKVGKGLAVSEKTPSRAVQTISMDDAGSTSVTPSNVGKRGRLLQASPSMSASPATLRKALARNTPARRNNAAAQPAPSNQTTSGDGTVGHPYQLSLRSSPNTDGCLHCPEEHCVCNYFAEVLENAYETISMKRVTEQRKREMCAKSVLPPFVSRMARVLKLQPGEVFYDLGCGNGSVLFQVAYMTGNPCVGVELSAHNAELARQTWALLQPILEKKSGRKMPQVRIVTGDLRELIATDDFIAEPCAVWTANLLMPDAVTHYMAERFRKLPPGSRILCFKDLYPHSRCAAQRRDPEAFRLFQMVDYKWQIMSVEWTAAEGELYYHRRTRAMPGSPIEE